MDPSGHAQTKKVLFESTEDNTNTRHNLPGSDVIEYTAQMAGVAAQYINKINEFAMQKGECFGQQYIVQKGLKKFGKKGKSAITKELQQLHDRECFKPTLVADLTKEEKKMAQQGLMFLTEKKSGEIKGRHVYNGKPTRPFYDKEDSASPTASL